MPRRCGLSVYPEDGTARADVITAALREQAASAGTRFVYDTAVTAIEVTAGQVRAVRAAEESLITDDVVIACGSWGPAVAALAGQSLPLVPVGHPYVYGPDRGALPATSTPPTEQRSADQPRTLHKAFSQRDGAGRSRRLVLSRRKRP